MPLPRMRTAAGVLAEIKEKDPNTEITMHYIRYLIHTNKIPVTSVGRKKLVDVDTVLGFLAEGAPIKDEIVQAGKIRPVTA